MLSAPVAAQWTIDFDVDRDNAVAAVGESALPAMYGALARVKTNLERILTGSTGAVMVTLTWAAPPDPAGTANAGSLVSRFYSAGVALAKDRLIIGANEEINPVLEVNLYEALPSPNIPFFYSGTTSVNATSVIIPSALNQHLGFASVLPGGDGTITVRPPSATLRWQFIPDNLCPLNLLFEAVVFHECLHLCGFLSNGDNLVQPTVLTSWDLFRFADINIPTTTAQFNMRVRELRPTVEASWLTRLGSAAAIYKASRGTRMGGDDEQASHWRSASRLSPRAPIGVMDPASTTAVTFNGNQNRYMKLPDAEALDLMGWNLNPATLSFANAESVTPIVPVQAAVIPLGMPLTFDWQTVGGETWMLVIYQGSEVVDGFPFRFYENLTDLSHTIPVAEALPTGQYTWYVVASTLAGYTTSGYRQFTIQPSCPADFNGDGIVDPDDLADFITCYFNIPPCPAADFNADGATDPDDLADYITAHFAGC